MERESKIAINMVIPDCKDQYNSVKIPNFKEKIRFIDSIVLAILLLLSFSFSFFLTSFGLEDDLYFLYATLFCFSCLYLIVSISFKLIDPIFNLIVIFYFTVMLIFGYNNSYGLTKSILVFLPSSIPLFYLKYRNLTKNDSLNAIKFFCLLVLFVAIIYKVQFGFFSRSVRYGFFGPIVAGWIFGIGGLLYFRVNKIFFLIFTAAIIWTFSKGPLIAYFIVLLYSFSGKFKVKFLLKKYFFVIVFFFFAVFMLYKFLPSIEQSNRLLKMLHVLFFDYQSFGDISSINIRLSFIQLSISHFLENPFVGTGLGMWGTLNHLSEHIYPHNIIAEIGAEVGLFGLISFALLVIFIFNHSKELLRIHIFLFIVMQFSGDLSYFKFIFTFFVVYHFAKNSKNIFLKNMPTPN